MTKLPLYLLLGIVFFATGCPKYKPSVNFKDTQSFAAKANEHLMEKQAEYLRALGRKDEASAKRVRNEAIESALPFIDAAYEDFITDITAGRDRTNFIADVVELGTSAAIGITNGERPLQILGVALTAFRGGRKSADLNFFRDQSTPILITKMDGNRAKVRAVILTREKERTDTYPIGAAIGDIVAYYNAGTLVRAFTELQKDTADQTKQQEDNLQVLKGVPLTPEAPPDTRNLSVGASDIIQGLLGELNDAATKEAATKKLQSIVAALEKDEQVKKVLVNADISSTETDGIKLRQELINIRRSATLVNDAALLNKINQAIVDNGQ